MFTQHLLASAVGILLGSAASPPPPLSTPFDFSRGEVELSVTVHGVPLHVLVDTGVDPSLIDLSRARALGLEIDEGSAGAASGFGDGEGAKVFATKLDGLSLGGRAVPAFDALASDMGPLSASYGRRLDGVLGFSFLKDKVVLVDYPRGVLILLPSRGGAYDLVKSCRRRWGEPLRTDQSYPVVARFRIGRAAGPATIDTGFNGGVSLFPTALALPGVRAAMTSAGAVTHAGARGAATSPAFRLSAPTGFGPFVTPPGQTVLLHDKELNGARIANLGNKVFATLKTKLLLDYHQRVLAIFGDCA